jgi:DNA-binding CsgD family transcriptional regulator
MIHLWKVERERPGQTLSWYLQSCSFHLRHYLASGRSIDSSKRCSLQIELPEDGDLRSCVEWSPVEQSIQAQVEVRECIRLMPRYLGPRERAILRCLVDGLKPREIARYLILSLPTVNKCRRKIAALAIRLGFAPGGGAESARPAVREILKIRRDSPRERRAENGHVQNGHVQPQVAAVNRISPATAQKIGSERRASSRREGLPRVQSLISPRYHIVRTGCFGTLVFRHSLDGQ